MKKILIFSLILTLGLFFFSCTEKNTVEIKDKISSLNVGETHQLICVVLPLTLQAEGVSWESSNTTVASISDTGLIEAFEEGNVTITCRSNGNNKIYDTMPIQVITPTYVVSTIEIKGSASVTLGQDVQYSIKVTPEKASKEVLWSVNKPIVASISNTGLLHPLGTGVIIIKAISLEDSLIFAELSVTITRSFDAVQSITVSGDLSLSLTETKTYHASVLPATANPVVTWSVDQPTLGTISMNGVLTPLQAGTIKVIATSTDYSSKKGELDVTILLDGIALESLLINGCPQVTVGTDYSYTVNPSPSDATSIEVLWEVDNLELATVNAEGILHPLAPGNIILTATSIANPLIQDSYSIQIYSLVQSVTLNSEPVSGFLGSDLVLEASVIPSTAIQDLLWTVDNEEIATINPTTGLLHPLTVGIVTVTVTSTDDNTKYATWPVTIYEVISTFNINGNNTVRIGTDASYTVSIAPANADQRYTWYIADTTKATISEIGLLHPLQLGVITLQAISVSNPNKVASLTITIKPTFDDVETISVAGPTTVKLGSTGQYEAAVLPLTAILTVTWTVDKPSLASISASGVLTPTQIGDIKVIATSTVDGITNGEFDVTIDYADIASVEINGLRNITLGASEEEEYSVTIAPLNACQLVTWSHVGNASGDTRNGNYYLSPIGPGTITLKATSQINQEQFWTITITVVRPTPTSISSTNLPDIIFVGQEIDLTVSILPVFALQTFTADPNDTTVRIVENHLTAVSPGMVLVVFTSSDNLDVYCTKNVVIKNHEDAMNTFLSNLVSQDYSIVREDGAYMIHSSSIAYVARHSDLSYQINPIVGYFKSIFGVNIWMTISYDATLYQDYNYFAYLSQKNDSVAEFEVNQLCKNFSIGSGYLLLEDGTIKYPSGNLLTQLNKNNLHDYLYLIFDLNQPEFFLAAYNGALEIEFDKYLISHEPADELNLINKFRDYPSPYEFYTIDTFENFLAVNFQVHGYSSELATLIPAPVNDYGYSLTFHTVGDGIIFMNGHELLSYFIFKINNHLSVDYSAIIQANSYDTFEEMSVYYILGEIDDRIYVLKLLEDGIEIYQLDSL